MSWTIRSVSEHDTSPLQTRRGTLPLYLFPPSEGHLQGAIICQPVTPWWLSSNSRPKMVSGLRQNKWDSYTTGKLYHWTTWTFFSCVIMNMPLYKTCYNTIHPFASSTILTSYYFKPKKYGAKLVFPNNSHLVILIFIQNFNIWK
jgi:hypothetical protein